MNIADILHTSSPKNMFFPQTLELGYGTSQRSENLKTWMWMAILKSWIIVKYSENRKKQQPILLKAKRILKPKYKLSGGFRFDIKTLDEALRSSVPSVTPLRCEVHEVYAVAQPVVLAVGAELGWRGLTSHRRGASSQHSEKIVLRNDSEFRCRGSPNYLKNENTQKTLEEQQPTENKE